MNFERKIQQFRSMKGAIRGRVLTAIIFGTVLVNFSAAQTPPVSRLKFTQDGTLLNCEPVSSVPCFRIGFSALNADGSPAFIPALAPSQLASSLTIDLDNRSVKPFFASFAAGTSGPPPSRPTLFLIDISGSMNKRLPNGETRFEAAKAALTYFLKDFEDGVDSVAIVGFGSRGVATAIRSARFATSRADAQSQVDTLPIPKPKNNTALYSAVDIGLDALRGQIEAIPARREALLFLLTDGENDVRESLGDDRGLLSGPSGLQIVAQKVQKESTIRVVAVGIGNPREVNQDALSQISHKFTMITDVDTLTRAFKHPAPTMRANNILATFVSPWPDRASLAQRALHLRVKMKLPTGEEFSSDEINWATPEIGQPLFAAKCDANEGDALLRSNLAGSGTPWMTVLRPILVFAGWGALLLILWFGVPRLIWADEYAGAIPQIDHARWGGGSIARRASPPAGRTAPAGFEQGRGAIRGSQRAASDETRMAPANFTVTRTRLERNPPSEREGRK